jgi:cell division protein FtsZ
MPINLTMPQPASGIELKPRITVVGVGGAGCNAVNDMIRADLEGVEYLVTNTDAQALSLAICERRIQLGVNITQGLGAGARPDVGRAAAEEALDDILAHLQGQHMVFIAAGMGGGTGTGAAPVIARACRERGILTVGVVTRPFHFEGSQRMRIADQGIEELQGYVDTLIVIPNQNLFRIANEKTTFADAFKMADEVLYSGVRGVTDLMVMPGLINLDFADIRTVMSEMGKAMMGTGEGEGERRALNAAEAAISNPLLDDVSMKGARGVLINITGGPDLTLFEVDEAANRIRSEVDEDANIIFGSTFDERLMSKVRISVVATGIDQTGVRQPIPGSNVHSLNTQRPPGLTQRPQPARSSGTTLEAPVERQPQPAASSPPPFMAPPRSSAPITRATPQPPAQPGPAIERPAPAARPSQPALDRTPAPPAEKSATSAMAAPVDRKPTIEPPAQQAPFIPPRPIEPLRNSQTVQQASHTSADPFAAAELANSGRTPVRDARSRGADLFRRVTGGFGLGGRPAAPAASPAKEPAKQPSAAPAQTRLDNLDPAERLPNTNQEEDLLDIPAFLRRQAN